MSIFDNIVRVARLLLEEMSRSTQETVTTSCEICTEGGLGSWWTPEEQRIMHAVTPTQMNKEDDKPSNKVLANTNKSTLDDMVRVARLMFKELPRSTQETVTTTCMCEFCTKAGPGRGSPEEERVMRAVPLIQINKEDVNPNNKVPVYSKMLILDDMIQVASPMLYKMSWSSQESVTTMCVCETCIKERSAREISKEERVMRALTPTQMNKEDKPSNKVLIGTKATLPVDMRGNPCHLISNYVHIEFKDRTVFIYKITSYPERLLDIKKNLLKDNNNYILLDTTLYSLKELSAEDLIMINSMSDWINITITYVMSRKLSEMTHLYNILFKQILEDMDLIKFKRNYFDQQSANLIPQHKVEIWPGYSTTISEQEGGLMLTIDTIYHIVRATENVYTVLSNTVINGGDWKEAFRKIIVGRSVFTTFNEEIYTVHQVDFNEKPTKIIGITKNDVQEMISLKEFYKKWFNITIKHTNQPLLLAKLSKTNNNMYYLIPELCQITNIKGRQRNNYNVINKVRPYTKIMPIQRHIRLKKFITNLLNNQSASTRLANWGLTLDSDTLELTGRILPPEPIYFGNDIVVDGKPNADWSIDVTSNPVMTPVDVTTWVILYRKEQESFAQEFANMVTQCALPLGIKVANPDMVLMSWENKTFMASSAKVLNKQLQLVVVISGNDPAHQYYAIKRIFCTDYPVPSQIIKPNSVNISTVQKILLQINCKLGGILWNIKIAMNLCMIVGIDVYHDPKRKNLSVCGFVSSYNHSMTQWYSKTIFQNIGQEIVHSLKDCIYEALEHYKKHNGIFPTKVIVYRDGVGDGELNLVRNHEIPQMQVTLSNLGKEYTPSLTYIVVQKRIKTKLFSNVNGELGNPVPGTVIDNTITRPYLYDFFLASHVAKVGCTIPSHYIVLYDNAGMSPYDYQLLTFKMCHLYFNQSATIKIPAPCYYAHKLAYLIGHIIKTPPSAKLSDKLYFL